MINSDLNHPNPWDEIKIPGWPPHPDGKISE